MASNEPVMQIIQSVPPAANAATPDERPGGSTPAENWPCFDFDDTTTEYRDYLCLLEGYDGGGLTFKWKWSGTSATTGTVQWSVAIRRVADDAEDLDSSHSYSFQNATATATSSTLGNVTYTTLNVSHGANMDNWADGEMAMVRVRRNVAGDNMSGDAELLAFSAVEQ